MHSNDDISKIIQVFVVVAAVVGISLALDYIEIERILRLFL